MQKNGGLKPRDRPIVQCEAAYCLALSAGMLMLVLSLQPPVLVLSLQPPVLLLSPVVCDVVSVGVLGTAVVSTLVVLVVSCGTAVVSVGLGVWPMVLSVGVA